MRQLTATMLASVVSLSVVMPTAAFASEENKAKQLCKEKIRDVYGVSNTRQVWGEQLGHHKFKIHGQVKDGNHKYPFNCKVKKGHVKSYAYDGPHSKHSDNDDSDLGTAIAVGAGLAIIAAIASQSDSGHNDSGSLQQSKKTMLEDDCHDMLQYRLRDEHDYTAQVHIKNSHIKGYDLVGDAKVSYGRNHAKRASYTCHFDHKGRLKDSSYHVY